MKEHVDRAQNGRGTYFILSRRHWQETRGLLITSRRSCDDFFPLFLVYLPLSLSLSLSLSLFVSLFLSRPLYRVPTHSSARVCISVPACIDPDVVPVGIWLVLLMSIRQLSSMNGVGGYLAHTAVVPGYLPPVSMATNRCF